MEIFFIQRIWLTMILPSLRSQSQEAKILHIKEENFKEKEKRTLGYQGYEPNTKFQEKPRDEDEEHPSTVTDNGMQNSTS